MAGILNILGSYSDRELKKINPIVDKIELLESEYKSLSDSRLRDKTLEFKKRLDNGETVDNILPEAFAAVREAAFRVLGMRHYRVQLIGGIVLHQGRIAEMKTGEGKTLVATLPAYLNALKGAGVHVITTNDYLAKRDRDEMGQVHEFLGLTTGVIIHDMKPQERKAQYDCDVVYGTNSEFGFDYLRDNMVKNKEERVQRGLNYCIVDEVDSILIDEARTPLIISGEGEKSSVLYKTVDKFVKTLEEELHYEVDKKGKAVVLTEDGVVYLEKTFGIENYADLENRELQHHITQSLRANYTMHLNKDYIVKKGEIYIVDEFTGRVMEGRRFSEGLHEAIEAKEGVKIQKQSKTLATITLQNYFRMYNKLAGMSGTAVTEELEFQEIYKLDVIAIPTNRPVQRIDYNDVVYKTLRGKYNAIVEEIIEAHENGQPVLVGTSNIQKSEDVSYLLKRRGIKHYVLNAKHHEKEAKIVEKAGEKGAITIATNMAGRGTDIKISDEVKNNGGLKIIGTDRHESRRIDNQLRGRAGRQGDPGSSKFFISLQDELIKRFMGERYETMFSKLDLSEDMPLESKMVSKAVENSQKNIEGDNFEIRKNLIGFDDVVNRQRLVIYEERNLVLDEGDVSSHIKSMIKFVVEDMVKNYLNTFVKNSNFKKENEENIRSLIVFIKDFGVEHELINTETLERLSIKEIIELLEEVFLNKYEEVRSSYEEEIFLSLESGILLTNVDEKWIDHIDNMEHLKQGIKLRAYKQVDPVREFQVESSEAFYEMVNSIKKDTISHIMKLAPKITKEEEELSEDMVLEQEI